MAKKATQSAKSFNLGLTIRFRKVEDYEKFCSALVKGGMGELVVGMGRAMLFEMKRRGIPVTVDLPEVLRGENG